MAFKMKGSAFKLGNVATKSALKQASPMKVAGGKFKTIWNPETEEGDKIQISDQDYADILAQNKANRSAENEFLAWENNPTPSVHAEGLDATEYNSIGELEEALSTMDPASQEYHNLADTLHFEMSDAGKKMTADQRKLSMNSALDMKSPFEQNYDNIAKIDHKEGTNKNIETHKKNETETYKSDLNADEMNAKLAKTRHLASDKKEEVTLPDPKKKYPKNKKEPKEKKKTYKKRRTKLPKKKKTLNLVTGGYNITFTFVHLTFYHVDIQNFQIIIQ